MSGSFKNHPQAVIEDVEDERTGNVRKRYVNRSRFVGFSTQKIGHGHAPGDVPTGPVKALKEKLSKLDQRILARLNQVSFPCRGIWRLKLIVC